MTLLSGRVSIGTRLAIQYGLALLTSLVLFALLVEAQVERRISREAQILLRLQLVDLVDDYNDRATAGGTEQAEAWLARHAALITASADPAIGLGVELLGPDGSSIFGIGSLENVELPVDRELLRGHRDRSFRAVNLGREAPYLSLTEAVQGGLIRVAVDTTRFSDNVDDIRRTFLISIPLVLLVSCVAGFLLSRRAIRPLAEINRVARRITSQNLEASIPISGSGDELDQLAETLNAMIERIRLGVRRLGRFSANVAHELRSPLNRIRIRLDELTVQETLSGEQREALETVRRDVDGLSREIEAMLQLARFEQGLSPEQRKPVELGGLVETVVDFFEPEAQARMIGIDIEIERAVEIEGEEVWLRMMLSNLVSNAIKYTRRDGHIRIALQAGPEMGRISVSDTGPGIEAEHLDSVFERFERGTQREDGFGLGLPIALEIARAHGGDIEVRSQVGHGTTFVVTLPSSG